MSQNLLSKFGNSHDRVCKALESMQKGGGILVVDDENRENEGDLIFSASSINNEQMAMLIRECSGIVCLCLTEERAELLDLPPMVEHNTSINKTAFTVTIEAAQGVSTGVSAADRVTTIRAAVAKDAKPEHLNRPGHIFPLIARPKGVLERGGHTEASVDMARLAGFDPFGVLCELTNKDGTMSRLPEISVFAKEHNIPLLSVQDIIEYRKKYDKEILAV